MKLANHSLLKAIVTNKELTLENIQPYIKSEFLDYRDYYSLACLVVNGYVFCDVSNTGNKPNSEFLLASIFYAQATGTKKVNNFYNSSGNAGLKYQIFRTTAKAELYFDELNARRYDRFFTMLVGIIIGVSSALITMFLKSKF